MRFTFEWPPSFPFVFFLFYFTFSLSIFSPFYFSPSPSFLPSPAQFLFTNSNQADLSSKYRVPVAPPPLPLSKRINTPRTNKIYLYRSFRQHLGVGMFNVSFGCDTVLNLTWTRGRAGGREGVGGTQQWAGGGESALGSWFLLPPRHVCRARETDRSDSPLRVKRQGQLLKHLGES